MSHRHFLGLSLLLLLAPMLLVSLSLRASEPLNTDAEIQDLKQQVLELNRDLFILEEELLYPGDTRLSVFVSLDAGELFSLDAVQLSIDGEVVTHYLYTDHQLQALQRGGVQRLYTENVKAGAHELVAVFTGKGPHGRDYRRATELVIDKQRGSKNLELKIVDNAVTGQPDFKVREW